MIGHNQKLIIVVMIVLLFVWFISGKVLLNKTFDLEREMALQKTELGHQKGLLAKQDAFLARYEELKKEVSKSKGSDEKLSSLIDQVERWAKEEDLILHDVRPLPAEEESKVTLLKVTLELEGDMVKLSRFLHKIVSSSEPLKIERFGFLQKNRMGSQINLDLELALLYLEE